MRDEESCPSRTVNAFEPEGDISSLFLLRQIFHKFDNAQRQVVTEAQKRNQIIKRISRIPNEKLEELDELVSKLEQEVSPKSRTLSFAGAWEDIDESVVEDFTDHLIRKCKSNRRRINE